jgi:hypothetical protein
MRRCRQVIAVGALIMVAGLARVTPQHGRPAAEVLSTVP